MNRHRDRPLSPQALFERWSHRRVTPDAQALLAYGLVVALGAAAVLMITGAPFAHVPLGI